MIQVDLNSENKQFGKNKHAGLIKDGAIFLGNASEDKALKSRLIKEKIDNLVFIAYNENYSYILYCESTDNVLSCLNSNESKKCFYIYNNLPKILKNN